MTLVLQSLNIFLFVFHLAVVLFNISGWIWKSTRRWHLAAVLATAASWCVMGIWKGMGYCVLTDWHWQIRERLGYDRPDSYILLMIRDLTGLSPSSALLNPMIEWTFIACGVLTIVLNLRDLVRSRRAQGRMATS